MTAMDEQSLRQLIREALADQMSTLHPAAGAFAETAPVPQICEEIVNVGSDHELMAFVDHLLELSKDGRMRADIAARRHVFRLAGRPSSTGGPVTTGAPGSPAAAGMSAPPARFDCGLVTERSVNGVAAGTVKLILGKRARLTPLARDRARQRGLKIERSGQ